MCLNMLKHWLAIHLKDKKLFNVFNERQKHKYKF